MKTFKEYLETIQKVEPVAPIATEKDQLKDNTEEKPKSKKKIIKIEDLKKGTKFNKYA